VILIPTTDTAELSCAACHGDVIRDLACQNRGGGAFCAVRLKQLFDPASWTFIVLLVDLRMLKVSNPARDSLLVEAIRLHFRTVFLEVRIHVGERDALYDCEDL
jgi:hypothetical protein